MCPWSLVHHLASGPVTDESSSPLPHTDMRCHRPMWYSWCLRTSEASLTAPMCCTPQQELKRPESAGRRHGALLAAQAQVPGLFL